MQPNLPELLGPSPADLAACRQMIRAGSRSFYTASHMLPEPVRDAAISLYAFCRVADDMIDTSSDIRGAMVSLARRLDNIYRLRPGPYAADRAFAQVVAQFAIPRALPEALLEGFDWDASGKQYDDLSDLNAYAVRVAGTVGAMMSIIMGRRDPIAIARACDLGVAMQLTNIARDVGEDARCGRLYLPKQWLVEAGIHPRIWLANPTHGPELACVIARLLGEAAMLYKHATAGIALLPPRCRGAVHASRLIYSEIGREIERRGYDGVSTRAVVPHYRKLALLAAAAAASVRRVARVESPPLPEAQFVVNAVTEMPAPVPRPQDVAGRVQWVIDLFLRLEAQRS